ncbi:hypothetical protein K470DRAFT_282858 [Piedraia hortae CBS 480.64]|uniref:Uncharacterized protein n=1 Tax=Piedraia hortae CBS 480.64 TaxID=1314780 RepID=A0A6A7BVB0_9PEZI|nr:hypothetical protein K470DRAFT_282858 [Piedraia hortae CBS 480.64]
MEVLHTLDDKPTGSHALAVDDHDEKGAAQVEPHVATDLGWNEPEYKLPDPLVGGLKNDDLWVLIRRFNKQMYHVKESRFPVPGNLDLNVAEDEEFSPDKLRATIERIYMTIGMGILATTKHVARLRSWRETRRTAAFCLAYTVAWMFDFLVPLLSIVLITLIMYPRSRSVMFPPVPIALISADTGGIQKPAAGMLGSTDSATGAAENHKGEAVEQEATHFVNGIASVALSGASGKHPQAEPTTEAVDDKVPDPTAVATGVSEARVAAQSGPQGDKAKVPMETAMWNKMRPLMHGLGEAVDTWERLGNALSPTPPFPRDVYRLRLASVMVPLLGISIFTTPYTVIKSSTFMLGFIFFGDPIIQRGLALLNRKFPKWQKLLELRNTLLKGIPTNAQLTLTLLRIGEANNAPLPPPPSSLTPPPEDPAIDPTHPSLDALDASDGEVSSAIDPTSDTTPSDPPKKSKGKRVLGVVKGGVKGAIETALGADKLKAKVGSENAKKRVGVIPSKARVELEEGPKEFRCRFRGKRGTLFISDGGEGRGKVVTFCLDRKDEEVWSLRAGDVAELKKIGGFGWKAKLVVGWALDREVADGLEIVDRHGEGVVLTAMVLRDELFNRLVALGGQKWVSY